MTDNNSAVVDYRLNALFRCFQTLRNSISSHIDRHRTQASIADLLNFMLKPQKKEFSADIGLSAGGCFFGK